MTRRGVREVMAGVPEKRVESLYGTKTRATERNFIGSRCITRPRTRKPGHRVKTSASSAAARQGTRSSRR